MGEYLQRLSLIKVEFLTSLQYTNPTLQGYGGPISQRDSHLFGNEEQFKEQLKQFVINLKNEMGPNSEAYYNFKLAVQKAATQYLTLNLNLRLQGDFGVGLQYIDQALADHVELKQNLNVFLPYRFKFEMVNLNVLRQYQDTLDVNQAYHFIMEVQHNTPQQVYQQFISILKQQQNSEITDVQMNQTIEELLGQYPDLLQKFRKFNRIDVPMPEQTNTVVAQQQKTKKIGKKQDSEKASTLQAKQVQRTTIRSQPQQKGVASYIGDEHSEYSTQRVPTYQPPTLYGQLKNLSKHESQFFDHLRRVLRDESYYDDIMKCFYCYIEGVFSQYEFFMLIRPLFDKYQEEFLNQFKTIVASRDNTRRHHNLLCKPFSEFDTSHFKKISYSYYEMPQDFPKPLCLGRSNPDKRDLCKEVFNDVYSSLPQGSESFKFKTKNQYEDVLFKLEDDMYKMDFEINNLYKTMKMLETEKCRIEQMSDDEQYNYKLDKKKFTKVKLDQIEKIYLGYGQKIIQHLQDQPVQTIKVIYERFKTNYDKYMEEKKEQLKIWHDLAEKNFYKSLDHRSFHFKYFEKKNQQSKIYLQEIKNIAHRSLKNRSEHELKGGSKNCDFFCTYSQFEHIVVHPESAMNTPELCNDFPINMKEAQMSEIQTEKLPHMRFLINNDYIFNLTCQMILASIRLASNGSSEKEKMRNTFKFVLEKVLNYQNLQEAIAQSREINVLEDGQFEYICTKDYYEGKLKGEFNYTRISKAEEQEDDQQMEDEEKKTNEEKQNIQNSAESNKEAAANSSSSPEQQKQNRNISMNEQLKLLTMQNYETDQAYIQKNSPFYPYFTPDYNLLYGSQHFYVILRQIYTVYERIMKAQEIIGHKVDEDIATRTEDHEQLSQISDDLKKERFEVFLAGVLLAMHPGFDNNKYEDFARYMLGSKAYLLFSFDKFITYTIKQLLNLSNDESSQKSINLYQKFLSNINQLKEKKIASEFWHNESIYLQNFATVMYPLSKIITVHYFSLNPFPVSDKKYNNEMINFVDHTVTTSASADENNVLGPGHECFLIRNKKKIDQEQRLNNIQIDNQLIHRVQPQTFRKYYEQGTNDVMICKRKSRLNVNEEFFYDLKIQMKTYEVKRRCFDRIEEFDKKANDTQAKESKKIERDQ